MCEVRPKKKMSISEISFVGVEILRYYFEFCTYKSKILK